MFFSILISSVCVLWLLKLYDLFYVGNELPKKIKKLLELGNIDKVHME
jgi:hypothetical protein